MRNGYHRVNYRAMPAQSRFGLISWPFHNEVCYTGEELQFRAQVLTARTNSGLDPDLLQTSNTWFANDVDSALLNVNENSWLFGDEYRPRQELSQEDFHIDLIQSERLNWPGLSTMMRVIGDYLLLRNHNLSPIYLNQPMNYVLLDVVQILKRLAMIENADYVANQLQLLRKYLRAVEIHVSPTIGSDRLFLADCRRTLEQTIQADIENKIHSQQLKNRIHHVHQQLNHVAELRHTVLHFALAEKPVNPHPYWEDFTKNQQRIEAKNEFPTLAAKACATPSADELIRSEEANHGNTLAALQLSAEDLSNCPDFKFIDQLSTEIKNAYSKSLIDLQEILRFQGILDRLLQLFDQAGEVFTLIQFREQMLNLLQNIEQFVQYSQQNIIDVLEANANAYHQYIQDKQDLRWWEKLLTNKQAQIDGFIINQDNLARFAATPTDLQLASKELLQQVNQVINHLNQQASETKQIELVSATRELVHQLMDSMHAWIGHQHQLQGLPLPEKPSPLQLSIPDVPVSKSSCQLDSDCTSAEEIVQTSSASRLTPFQFWSSAQPRSHLSMICTSDAVNCNHPPLSIGESPHSEIMGSTTGEGLTGINSKITIGFLLLLPIGVLFLKLLYDSWQESVTLPENDQAGFKKWHKKTADLLSKAIHQAEELDDEYWQNQATDFIDDFKSLEEQADKKKYNAAAMQNLHDDIEYFIKEMQGEKRLIATLAI